MLFTIATLLGLTAFFNAMPVLGGCYKDGVTWTQLGTADANQRRSDFCTLAAKEYNLDGTRPSKTVHCYNFHVDRTQRADFSVRLTARGSTVSLSKSDCIAALTIEMNACSHGSIQTHGKFEYISDPNDGHC